MLAGTLIDTLVVVYLEEFGKHPDGSVLSAHDIRNYFIWANDNGLLFWEEENNVLKAFAVGKPTYYGYDWWDYDPNGPCLNIFLYVQLCDDDQVKWRLLKQGLERFPHCTEAVWTHNKLNEKRRNICLEPFSTSIERIKKQLKRHLKE